MGSEGKSSTISSTVLAPAHYPARTRHTHAACPDARANQSSYPTKMKAQDMTQRYRKFKRSWGMWYAFDNVTGNSVSLKTRVKAEAETKVAAMNETERQPSINLGLAKVYLNATDPKLATRTWQEVMEHLVAKKTDETKQRWETAIKAMLARHRINAERGLRSAEQVETRLLEISDLKRFVAGADVFSRQSDGTTIAAQYAKQGITLRAANTDQVNGWAEVMQGLGEVAGPPAKYGGDEPEGGVIVRPTLFIHQRCGRLIETLPALQHDPNRPEDVLKVDADEDGVGGDDAADCLRYLVATKTRTITQRKLRGL